MKDRSKLDNNNYYYIYTITYISSVEKRKVNKISSFFIGCSTEL